MRIAASGSTTRDLPLPAAIDLIAGLGYGAFEIWVEYLWEQELPPARLGHDAAARGLVLAVHGPQRDLNVTSTNPGIRGESQRQYLRALEDAAEMGARMVVLHPGCMSSAGDEPHDFWPVLDGFFGRVADRAGALALQVGVEHMERRRLEYVTTPELVVAMLRRLDHAALGLTLDLAHQLHNGDALNLDDLLPHVCHVHVSGSTRQKVHVPMTEGIYPVAGPLRELARRFKGIVTIEGYVCGRGREILADNLRCIRGWLAAAPPAV